MSFRSWHMSEMVCGPCDPPCFSSFPNITQRTLSPGKNSKRWDRAWTPPHAENSHLPFRNTYLGLLHKGEIRFSCIKPLNVLRLICYSSYLLLWQIQTVSWHIYSETCLEWYITKMPLAGDTLGEFHFLLFADLYFQQQMSYHLCSKIQEASEDGVI